MPNPIMRSFAKKADTTVKKVEKLWNKSEKLVKKKYELTPEEDSDRFYALVVAVLKKILKIDEPNVVKEDDGGGDAGGDVGDSGDVTSVPAINTTSMGAYQYYSKIGDPIRRLPKKDIRKVYKKSEDESQDTDEKKLAKRIKAIVDKINGLVEHENILDEYLDYFRTRYESPEEIIEKTVEYVEKRLGITKSGLDA
jgi:hypothetical protein